MVQPLFDYQIGAEPYGDPCWLCGCGTYTGLCFKMAGKVLPTVRTNCTWAVTHLMHQWTRLLVQCGGDMAFPTTTIGPSMWPMQQLYESVKKTRRRNGQGLDRSRSLSRLIGPMQCLNKASGIVPVIPLENCYRQCIPVNLIWAIVLQSQVLNTWIRRGQIAPLTAYRGDII